MPRRPGSPRAFRIPTLPTVHLARDHPAPDVRARVRAGTWRRVHRGAYVDTPHSSDGSDGFDGFDGFARLALGRAVAIALRSTTELTFSHTTAALLWGLPAVVDDDAAHVTQISKPTTQDRGVRRHVNTLSPTDRTTRLGLPVTTLERTLIDCAMTLGPRAGLVIADAALRAGADIEVCERLLAARAGHRGVVGGRAVVEFADAGAESPGESLTRLVLLRAGLPRPQTQIPVSTPNGLFWADLGWEEWRLLVEYDGRTKYTANGPAVEAVLAERRRQDAIEEVGYRVLRVTKEDLRVDDRLLKRVRRFVPPGVELRPRVALGGPLLSPARW